MEQNIPRRKFFLATLLAGVFLGTLDTAIANVAAPSIRSTLHATNAELQLVIAGYVVAYASLLIVSARLGDEYGYPRLFRLGLGTFTIASLGCGLAPTATFLVAARVVQGGGAAMMVAQVLTGIQKSFSGAERSRALGFYAMALSLGAVTGQILGGVLVWSNVFHSAWRPVFLINVPIGTVLLFAAFRYLPAGTGGSSGRFDLRSIATLARIPAIAWGLTSYGFAVGTYYALLFTLSLYLQQGLGKSPLFSALTLLAWVSAFGVAGLSLPRLFGRSIRRAAPVGPLIIAATFLTIGVLLRVHHLSEALLVTLLGFGGFGLGTTFVSLMTHMTNAIPSRFAS
jgi:MFS family permease